MSYIKVYSGSVVDTQHIMQLLQNNGIQPVLRDNSSTAMLSGFGAVMPNFQELYVHEDEFDQSKRIINL